MDFNLDARVLVHDAVAESGPLLARDAAVEFLLALSHHLLDGFLLNFASDWILNCSVQNLLQQVGA
jgi:hypothetical protein